MEYFVGLVACECFGCVYLIAAHGSCTVTGRPLSFRGEVCWLKVFFVISNNICTDYLFQRNIFSKNYYSWCFECFSIIWLIFSICQCLSNISLRYGNVGLYVTEL